MAQEDLLNTVTNVLSFKIRQNGVLSHDKYDTISIIIHWKCYEICEWYMTKSKFTTTRVGSTYGDR